MGNEKHTQYYSVDNLGAAQINDEKGREEFKNSDLSNKALDLKDLDADTLLEMVRGNIQE